MNTSNTKYLLVVAGPTAVGKTRVAIELAKLLGTEIISADSRQCYREMNIGVARPSSYELAQVQHHFIASHSIEQPLNAALFEQEALACAGQLFLQHQVVVLVGGTGLYINALCEGLDEIPVISDAVKNKVRSGFELSGIGWLQEELKQKDPDFLLRGEAQNPHRLLRALEVKEATGRSILEYQKGGKKERPFQIIRIALDLPRTELYDQINHRVVVMMEQGLEQEAHSLLPWRNLPALQTVGYQELFDYFDGQTTLARAVELIQQHTRNYAKRQLTWFRRDLRYHWFSPQQFSAIQDFVSEQLV